MIKNYLTLFFVNFILYLWVHISISYSTAIICLPLLIAYTVIKKKKQPLSDNAIARGSDLCRARESRAASVQADGGSGDPCRPPVS